MPPAVFVAGGAGYIGSTVAALLLEAGYEVTVYDALVSGHRAAVPEGATFIQGDLADMARLQAALQQRPYLAVMHFAAFIQAGESMREPYKYLQNNITCSVNLIEAAVRAGVPRFVFSSTAAVYRSSEAPLTEDAPLGPDNLYGFTKLTVERILDWYGRIHGLRYAVLRYFNAAGARSPDHGEAHPHESHLIPLVLQVALGQREHITIYGTDYPTPDGTCIRDYIHVLDLAQAHLLVLEALAERAALTYNVGVGRGYSVREVVEAARRVTGHPIPVVEGPRRLGDPPRLVASAEKICRELGWQPRYTALEEIIASAWAWHQRHPYGYTEGT